MNKTLRIASIALVFFCFGLTQSVHAVANGFTLQDNKTLTGGTKIGQFFDTEDAGVMYDPVSHLATARILAADVCSFAEGTIGRQFQAGDFCRVSVISAPYGNHTSAIQYTHFNAEIFNNHPQIVQNTNQLSSQDRYGYETHYYYFAGPYSGGAATVTAALVANPPSIISGEQSLLTWSSTGALSCISDNFNTGGASSGSVLVSPRLTSTYTITCSDQPAQSRSCLADGEDVPAGHLCNASPGPGTNRESWQTFTWADCCSTRAHSFCPAPNEPVEAYCVGGSSGSSSGSSAHSATASATVTVTGEGDNDDQNQNECDKPNLCSGNNVVNACTGEVVHECSAACIAATSAVGAHCPAGQCVAGPQCVGVDLYYQNSDCTQILTQACAFGCAASSCITPTAPNSPTATLIGDPPLVKKGAMCTLSLSAKKVTSCSLVGTGINRTITADKNGTIATTTAQSPALINTATYTLTCQGTTTLVKKFDCKVTPTFQEF